MTYTYLDWYEEEDGDDTKVYEVTITYDYTPGSPAVTPRGEYQPTNPPEPPDISVRDIVVVLPKTNVNTWPRHKEDFDDWLKCDATFNLMCQEAESWLAQKGYDG